VLVARFPGSNNPVPRRIGDYPSMSLSDARALAMEWREDLRRGIDPKIKKTEMERAEVRRKADTFEAAFHAFADDHLSTLRTGAAVKSLMARHVLPRWSDKPISEIRRADVAELVRTLRKSMPIGANRILAYIKKMFGWLIDQDMIDASPAASIKRPAMEVKRDRVLAETEIRAIWNACGELGAIGRSFKLMLATGQRRSEVGSMTWSEVDRKNAVWTLPRGRTKADRAHEIPLSSLALEIIDEGPRLNDFGGWALYVKDGKPVYTYNWLGLKRFNVASDKKLEPGKATVVFKFDYDGGGPGKGGLGALFVNGEKVAEARIDQTQCCAFSMDEGADVGRNEGTPVTEDYQVPFAFNGTINKVTIELGETSSADRAATDKVQEGK
jgi:integrase